jgi:hypothetical protein
MNVRYPLSICVHASSLPPVGLVNRSGPVTRQTQVVSTGAVLRSARAVQRS